uniref:Uncharacterized protein n=1 Tax=Salix viminalis TaxID=40686 RepID=A0A6N2N9J9_SALVM
MNSGYTILGMDKIALGNTALFFLECDDEIGAQLCCVEKGVFFAVSFPAEWQVGTLDPSSLLKAKSAEGNLVDKEIWMRTQNHTFQSPSRKEIPPRK